MKKNTILYIGISTVLIGLLSSCIFLQPKEDKVLIKKSKNDNYIGNFNNSININLLSNSEKESQNFRICIINSINFCNYKKSDKGILKYDIEMLMPYLYDGILTKVDKEEFRENNLQCLKDGFNSCIAVTKKDSKLCESIYDTEKLEECKDLLISQKSIENNDIGLCSTTKNNTLCTIEIARNLSIKNKDTKICQIIKNSKDFLNNQNPETLKININNCISEANYSLAMIMKDVTLCEKIINKNQKEDCEIKLSR